ncbi:MAG TPA: hypothetical protein VLA82_04500 [Actinomycetota bacterium]|nr:hypothetical protein [Actinomycetota bacterium]
MARMLLMLILSVLLVGACERSGDDVAPSPTAPAPTTSPPPTLSSEGFLYTSKEGIRALATFDGARGRLEVENTTGAELAAPGLYVLDAATGAVVEADVSPTRPVADGDGATFRVRLDRPMPPASIGLVVLLIGDEDRGAFLPPAPQEEAA